MSTDGSLTADWVADRLYDGLRDLVMARHPSGILLPTTPLGIAALIVSDITQAHAPSDPAEHAEDLIPPERLGQAVAYVTERVRHLLPDDWRTTVLETTAAEILAHTLRILYGSARDTA